MKEMSIINFIKKYSKQLLTILLLIVISLPFLLEVFNFDMYVKLIKYFFSTIDFKDGIAIYINFTLLIFTIIGIFVNIEVLKFYLKSHNDILEQNKEIQKQNEKMNKENNDPLVTLKLLNKEGLLFLRLKNSGNSAAYNVRIEIEKEIIYKNSNYKTLNKLPIFNNLSILDRDEEIQIFYDSAFEFYNDLNEKILDSEIKIIYYNKPEHKRKDANDGKVSYNSILSFKELDGILYIHEYTLKDISKNLERLGDALIVNLEEDNEINNSLNKIANILEKFNIKNIHTRRWNKY